MWAAICTYCQSLRMCPFCRSLLRKATWHVLQVKGCDAPKSILAASALLLPEIVAMAARYKDRNVHYGLSEKLLCSVQRAPERDWAGDRSNY